MGRMGYFMEYDTPHAQRLDTPVGGDNLDDALKGADMWARDLGALRCRLFDVQDGQEPEAGRLVAVFDREHGWVRLSEDYRRRWTGLSPETRAAVRANPAAVPGEHVPELVRARLFVAEAHWVGEGDGEWAPLIEVQAFVRALPADQD